mmetsp:Transcript_80669/g.216206  ORF Transcript_80669/g.216206 Transcript_80669/m.216206 type:complete len:277 (+) Transcript_80669:393-1223(+)
MTSALALARCEPLSIRSGRRVPWARKTLLGSIFIAVTSRSVMRMKVSPMIMRLSSGEMDSARGPTTRSLPSLPLTVVVAAAKSAAQLTTRRSRPTLPSAVQTVSLSSWRMKPWSMWTACTRSAPTASRHSAAQTDESTPPETSTRISLSPTTSRISLSAAWCRLAPVKLASRPAMPKRKLLKILTPLSERSTSGWNWVPYMRFSSFSSATVRPSTLPMTRNPGASLVTASPWVSSTRSRADKPANRRDDVSISMNSWRSSLLSARSTEPPLTKLST